MSRLIKLDRVILNNPGGYNGYEGTVCRVFKSGGVGDEWADILWDIPHHPCTSPMQTRHLIPIHMVKPQKLTQKSKKNLREIFLRAANKLAQHPWDWCCIVIKNAAVGELRIDKEKAIKFFERHFCPIKSGNVFLYWGDTHASELDISERSEARLLALLLCYEMLKPTRAVKKVIKTKPKNKKK